MRLLLKVVCPGDFLDPQPAFAITSIDRDYALFLLRAIDVCKRAAQELGSVYAIEIFDSSCEWLPYSDVDLLCEGATDEPVVLDECGLPCKTGDPVAMTAETVLAEQDSVHWSGIVKRTDVPAHTFNVSRETLETAAQEQQDDRDIHL